MTLSTARKWTSLAEKAYSEIKEMIISGTYEPGDVLRQEALSAAMGISRTPIRQALERLHLEGLIKYEPGIGASVAEQSVRNIKDSFEARAVLESYAASAAVGAITVETIKQMEKVISDQLEAIELQDASKVYQLDTEFHSLLFKHTRNQQIVDIIESLSDQTAIHRVRMNSNLSRRKKSLQEHMDILAAVKEHDANKVQALMFNHLTGFCRDVLQEWFDDLMV